MPATTKTKVQVEENQTTFLDIVKDNAIKGSEHYCLAFDKRYRELEAKGLTPTDTMLILIGEAFSYMKK
jgi:hypothetical protein